MARNIITGLDIGSSTIRALAIEQKNDGTLNILASAQKDSEGVKRGSITNLDDAARTIRSTVKSLEKTIGKPIRSVVLSVGGISLGSARSKGMIRTSKADGEITEHDIKRLIAQSESNLTNIANKKIIHVIPLSFKVDNAIVQGRPTDMKGLKLEVETMFVTCISIHLADMVKTVESAGLAVDDVVAAPLATSCAVLTKQQKETGCILANIGASTVSVVVFEDGLPISLEVFPIGSSHITNDIALGLQVPLDEAEKIKINYGYETPSSKKKLYDIIEARLHDIFEMIEAHLKKINRNRVLPAGIVLSGSGSNLFSLEDMAKTALKLPAKVGALLPNSNQSLISASTPGNLKDQILNNPGWSVALGLCIAGANGGAIQEEGKSRPRIQPKIVHIIKDLIHKILP